MAVLWSFLLPALLLLGLLARAHPRRVVVLLSALLPTYLLRLNVAGIPTSYWELAVAVIALATAAQPVMRRRWHRAFVHLPAVAKWLIALFVLAALAAAMVSPHPRLAWGMIKGWVAVPLMFGWLAYAAGRQPRTRRSIVLALLASGVAMALIGLTQAIHLDRARGLYDVPNSLALFLAPLTVIAWWQKKRVASLVLAAGLLAAQSATALLAAITTLFIGAVLWPPRAARAAATSLVLFVLITTAYLAAAGRLSYLARPWVSHEPNSISVRLQLWRIAAELIREHPVRGIGLGAFESAYQQKLHERFARYELARQYGGPPVAKPLAEFVFRDPHNWLLSFWLNTGLLGLVSFAGLNVWVLSRALHRPVKEALTQSLALALVCLLLVGLADTIYWKNDLAALHWLLIGLLLHQIRADRVQDSPGQQRDDDAQDC